MSKKHEPLSAAEIGELRELEAKATKGPWVVEKPFSHPGVQAVMQDGAFDWVCHAQVSNRPNWLEDSQLIAAMRNALPRLLSMLQPPTDAAVREAVELVEYAIPRLFDEMDLRMPDALRTLLSYVRAVQSPRLTEAQMEKINRAYDLMMSDMPSEDECSEAAQLLREVHPGVFGKER